MVRAWKRGVSAVAIAGIAFAAGLGRSVFPRISVQPHLLEQGDTAALAHSPERIVIPHVNLDGLARPSFTGRALASDRPRSARNTTGRDDRGWTSTLPNPIFAAADEIPAAAAQQPLDGDRVPQLMVCHLDAAGRSNANLLQQCISRAPAYSSIEIPPGTYVLDRQVVVATPLTIRTAGTAGTPLSCATIPDACATFVAAPDFRAPWGMLLVISTNNTTLEHIVIDGARASRVGSISARNCLEGQNIFGFNASVLYCLNCRLNDVFSRNALCGTGMAWVGANAVIQNSTFQGNGDGANSLWADGLTAIYAPQSEIVGNRFIDNTDVAFIVGYGVASRIEHNVVQQRTQTVFAGLMLHNFSSNDLSSGGDFRGAVIAHNTVDCGAQLCVFGIQVGPSPWNPKLIVVGGDVHDNAVLGAKVGINVDGAGMIRAPVAIHDNLISAVPEGAYFSNCSQQLATNAMNISPTSVVNRGDETTPTGAQLSDMCQLSSAVTTED